MLRHAASEQDGSSTAAPPAAWRLTEQGERDAQRAGRWLVDNGLAEADRYFVAPAVRALQTAAALQLPGVEWRVEPAIAQRSWGPVFERASTAERAAMLAEARRITGDKRSWAPPGGECLYDIQRRLADFLADIPESFGARSVFMVTHAEVLLAAHTVLTGEASFPKSIRPLGMVAYEREETRWHVTYVDVSAQCLSTRTTA